METIWMTQKAPAMGNWWLAASLQQYTCLCITFCAVFLWNIKSSRWLSPLQPRFDTLQLLAFPKTIITFEREEISDHQWDSGKYARAADHEWNCVRFQGAYFEGDWGVIVLCTMFPVSCIFFNKWLYFSYYMAGYLLYRLHTHTHTHTTPHNRSRIHNLLKFGMFPGTDHVLGCMCRVRNSAWRVGTTGWWRWR